MPSLKEIKSRASAISSTRKITKAMELVAIAKLQQTRRHLTNVQLYGASVHDFFADLVANVDDLKKLIPASNGKGVLYILMMSDLGLCGGYNNNLARTFNTLFKPGEDQVIALGSKALNLLFHLKVKPVMQFSHIGDTPQYQVAASIAKAALPLYLTGGISRVVLIYTHFVNTITTEATHQTLLPLEATHTNKGELKPLTEFEPDAATVLLKALPLYLSALLFEKIMESKVAEYAARRVAMEGATDNASDLIDNLTILYNRVRQGRITQEISEIVAGAEAS